MTGAIMTKVKMLNIIGNPEGVIIFTYKPNKKVGILNPEYNFRLFRIQLDSGKILEDVSYREFEIIHENGFIALGIIFAIAVIGFVVLAVNVK